MIANHPSCSHDLQRAVRLLLMSIVVLVGLRPVQAQIRVWQAGQKEFAAGVSDLPDASVTGEAARPLRPKRIRIDVFPAAEAKPALRYRFWKAPPLRQPGSVNAGVSHATLLYLSHPRRGELDTIYAEETAKWDENNPSSRLMTPRLEESVEAQRDILRAIYAATKLREIVSQPASEGQRGTGSLDASLAAIQHYKNFARLIQLDVYISLDERDYDAVAEKIAAGFRLAEFVHDGNEMNLITKLVGIAISGVMLDLVEEAMQQPDSPNFYWALASLPPSLWDMRSAVDGEIASIGRVIGPIVDPIADDADKAQLREALSVTAETFLLTSGSMFDGKPEDAGDPQRIKRYTQLVVGGVVLLAADRARTELPQFGYSREQIDSMGDLEATVRATQLGLAAGRDQIFKFGLLEGAPESAVDDAIAQVVGWESMFSPANIVLGTLVPAIQAGQSACNRMRGNVKRQMIYQAFRAHVAEHGEVPEQLSELSPLPEVLDPDQNSSFDYKKLDDREALITWEARFSGEWPTEVVLRFKE